MRAIWKGGFIDFNLLKNFETNLYIFTTSRRSIIIPKFLNKFIVVNCGKKEKKIYITKEKLFFKIGSFASTRQKKKPNDNKKNKIKSKKK